MVKNASIDSIFKEYYSEQKFIDRKNQTGEEGLDVIVPIINTNELFTANIYCWYREIPINRLIIGYGGGTDNSLEEVKKFPRVKIIDQSKKYSDHLYGSQGICIAELMSLVKTEWFIYLHADVFLPENWYDTMKKYQNKYDWFECDREITALIKFDHGIRYKRRAYSGSQMGRKEAFRNIIPKIEDGYLQNNEDIIFQELILEEGFKYGRVLETKHYHQIMDKRGLKEPKYEKIIIEREKPREWKMGVYSVQAKGIIKYCKPKKHLIRAVNLSLAILRDQGDLNGKEFKRWVLDTNAEWLPYIKIQQSVISRILLQIQKEINRVFDLLIR